MPYIGKYLKIRKYKKAGSINTYNCQFWTIFLFLSRLFFFFYNFFDWLFYIIVLFPSAALLFSSPTLHNLLLFLTFFSLFFYSFVFFFFFCITFWTYCSIELFYLQPPLCYSLHPHYIASFFCNRFLKLLSLNHDNTSLLNMLFLLIMHLKKTQTCVKYT